MKSTIQLKICGLQPGDDLSFTEHPAVTHIGFIRVPASRRCVSREAMRSMVDDVRDTVQTVAVYVDESPETILAEREMAHFDIVQLHGKESIADCSYLRQQGLRLWKSVSVKNFTSVEDVNAQIAAYSGHVEAVLLDAMPSSPRQFELQPSLTGGNGEVFDWNILPQIKTTPASPNIWVAGGIRPENAHQLLNIFRPIGIDVSSGVEKNGRKSNERIDQLIKAVTSDVGPK
ncbi:MAG: phosphoribosylanthranilate isomerase [Alicyclobacillaceae bacterium]|jgi:phosphoribosylanthranilate isomerase|uniref:phosphoribosylanthranilate isomerase n=1 Tax=Alicyclobacillus sp. SP_1 TaxID=2942475 RepID=UPI002157699B|nr:phosphoribosylanthranilate isomerase [Alicyclobacillus sp. SP_1]MCY0888180.1 phosphoribosylanthranilate isomerase [Alicyclobacillaceae bacterium]